MAKTDKIGQIVRALVGVDIKHHGLKLDIANKLRGDEADEVHQNLTNALKMSTALPIVQVELLQDIGEPIEFPAVERFVTAEHFVLNKDREVPISYLGDNFKQWLLGLTETNVPAITVRQRKLLKQSVDTPILTALGGEIKAKTFMAHVHEFLKTADRTKWYLFYITTVSGTVCALYAGWYGDGWYLDAYSVSDPGPWRDGGVVVAR